MADSRRVVVQLAGTNGSGKSSALKQLWDVSEDRHLIEDETGKIVMATWLADIGCVVMGTYHIPTGGGDSMTSKAGGLAGVTKILRKLLQREDIAGLPLFFEGLLLASYVNIHNNLIPLMKEFDTNFVIVHCDPEYNACLSRIYVRNNNKPINEGSVHSRHKTLRTMIIPRLRSDGEPNIITWKTGCQFEDMSPVFLNIVEDAMLGRAKEVYE